jgi:hypothetical protein
MYACRIRRIHIYVDPCQTNLQEVLFLLVMHEDTMDMTSLGKSSFVGKRMLYFLILKILAFY